MKWLVDLENFNISFNIKILQKNDYILANEERKNYKRVYILDGFIQKLQIFTNGEVTCLQLLYNNDQFNNIKACNKKQKKIINYYHQFKALKTSALIIIQEKEWVNKLQTHKQFTSKCNYIQSNTNQDILSILSHKNIKKRLIQLLLILAEKFGVLANETIFIPINISHYTIAIIIGSQRITVNRIMNKLKRERLIYYDDRQITIFNIIKLIEF